MKILIAALAFAFFILCPRMAGITSIIARTTDVDLIKLAVVGNIIAIPCCCNGTYLLQIWFAGSLGFCRANRLTLCIDDKGDKL